MRYNRNYAKLIDGALEYAPVPLVIDGENVWTNIDEKYLEHGFKKLVFTEEPSKEGYFYTTEWVEHEAEIVQEWLEHEIPEPEPPVETVTEEEIEEAIREGVNSIDGDTAGDPDDGGEIGA